MAHGGDPQVDGRFRLPPGAEAFLAGADRLMVRTAFGTTAFSGALIGSDLLACIRALDGTRTFTQAVADVAEGRRADCISFLHALAQRQLLVDTAAVPAPEAGWIDQAHDPHEVSYWRLHAPSAQMVQQRLQEASVLVYRLGGMGVALASTLAVAGVGTLILVDHQPVREADLNHGFLASTLGTPRARALADRLRQSSAVNLVVAPASLDDDAWDALVAPAHLVVLTSDNMALAGYERTNDSCLRLGTPWVSARIDRDVGIIGPYVVPGQTACFACYELRIRANADHASDHEALFQHWHTVDECPPDWPVLAAATQLVGQQLALDVLRVVGGHRLSAAHGRVLHTDLDTLTCKAHELLKLPRCPACSRARLRPLNRIWDVSEASLKQSPP